MNRLGQKERRTQQQVLEFFQKHLGCRYSGEWKDRDGNSNIEEDLLRDFLTWQGHEERIINRALRELDQVATLLRNVLNRRCVPVFTGPVAGEAEG